MMKFAVLCNRHNEILFSSQVFLQIKSINSPLSRHNPAVNEILIFRPQSPELSAKLFARCLIYDFALKYGTFCLFSLKLKRINA